jgi:hypothetical protein
MNQNLLSIFSVVVNEKTFQFLPANSNFEEVSEALDLLKKGFEELKAKAVEAEAEKAEDAKKEEQAPVEPEIVNA